MDVADSPRLTYRLLGEDDAELFYKLDKDPAVMRYINGGKAHTIEYIRDQAIPRLMAYTDPEKGHGMWGVFTKGNSKENTKEGGLEENKFIGWILIRPMDFFSDKPEFDNLEIGWRFTQASWGKGYGTEAAEQVKQAIIALGGINAITAVAMPDNAGSINIMEKIGLHFVKQYLHHDSQLGDVEAVYYQLKV